MKTSRKKTSLFVALVAILALLAAGTALLTLGCGGDEAALQSEVTPQGSETESDQQVAPSAMSEEQWLLYLREEEKLARDVYLALYDKWGITEFSTIADSEVRHMASVKNLLDRIGLEDPVGDDVPGMFVNEELQRPTMISWHWGASP